MLLIGLLIGTAWLLSSHTVRRAVPFESFLAVGLVGVVCVVLFQIGRLV